MQPIYCFLNYSNPLSHEFQKISKDFYKLERWRQGIVIIAAIAAGIFGFGISAFAAFRFTVEKLQKGGNAVADRTNTLFQETISSSKSKNSSPLMFRETASLINNAKQFAPDKGFPIELEIEGTQFIIWYDSHSRSAIIEKADEPDQAITISNSSFLAENQEQMEIVEHVYRHLLELKEQFNRERRQFQPQTLKIIKCFFESEKGNEYDAENPLEMGDGIHLWPEKHNNPRTFYLHVRIDSVAQEIKISLDNDGQINAVELNNQKRNPLFLFEEDEIWKNLLTLCFHDFLKENALKHLGGSAALIINGERVNISGTFGYHNAIISELPEYVLSKLARKQMYRYLNDDLTVGPGIDFGGLKRQMFSELALHLFDGSPNREIQVIQGIPALRNSESNKEKELLEMAGKNLIRTALTDNTVTLGNILDPVVYECFNLLIKFDNKTTDDVFMQAAQLLCKTEQLQFLFDVYNRPRIFTDEEKNLLEDILMIEDVKDSMTDPLEAQKLAKNYILDCYKKQIMAIHYMVKGALGSSQQKQFIIRTLYERLFDHLTPEKFCEQIQGIKFDPQGIADRIFTDSDHPVVRQKTAWLKEYILSSDEEEIKRVLMAITGSTTITAKTKVKITGTRAYNCIAHTCSTSLEVPITHTSVGTDTGTRANNKQLFLNNFKLIYSENGFDMG